MITGRDYLANYAYYALHKLRIRPSEFCEMDTNEQAFIIACIDIRLDAEKKAADEVKKKTRRR